MLHIRFDRLEPLRRLSLIPIVLAALIGLIHTVQAMAAVPHLGYGANVAVWDITLLQSMGFDWIKVFSPPSGGPLPLHTLVRVDANAQALNDLASFNAGLDALLVNKNNVDAWEIGNEVNLDANYGWNAAPDPVAYKNLLCDAYGRIKAARPTAIVVSAGLAPTGRVIGTYHGYLGHNGAYQDEREFLKAFLVVGGGACLDAIGYHPYGFSADYNAAPDIASADPTQNCANGFCFRGVEKIYAIMQNYGLGQKQVWATEFGWLLTPPSDCLTNPSFQGRTWQLVSADKQASNLAGAYQYADANYPWMGPMFIFNLNFNTSGWYGACDQMTYYSIEGRPAQTALTTLTKNVVPGRLQVSPSYILMLIKPDWQPVTQSFALNFSNTGWQTLRYTVTVNSALAIVPTLTSASRNLNPMITKSTLVVIGSTGRITGSYTGTLTATASIGALGVPITIPIELRVVDVINQTYLPLISVDNAP